MKDIFKRTYFPIISLLLMLTLFCSICNFPTAFAAENKARPSESEEDAKIYCEADLSDDFTPDKVIVILDKEISDIDGVPQSLTDQLFEDIEVSAIKDQSKIGESAKDNAALRNYLEQKDFRQILSIELAEPSKQNVLDAIERLEKVDGILYAGPNYLYSIDPVENEANNRNDTYELPTSSAPNDPNIDRLWGLFGDNGINAQNAWGVTTGSKDIRVGVIDSGIANHEDLNANVAEGHDFFNDNTTTSDDELGHGTHVAGTIGAVADNGIGISGVAQNVTLVPLQASYWDNGRKKYLFDADALIDAIKYATDLWGTSNQISILNYSISGFGTSVAIQEEVSNFPGLFVWSAGNDNLNVDEFEDIDQFNTDNIISVGAINSGGHKCFFSNYGQAVDVYAPGRGIYSTIPGNKYGNKSGTSMAAPHVSGTAALLWSLNPDLTASEVKEAIVEGAVLSTVDTPDGEQEARILNAADALAYAEDAPEPVSLSVVEGSSSGNWKVNIQNNNAETVTVTYNERMCFEDDAKNFYHLTNLRSFRLAPFGDRTVTITGFGTATHIAVAISHQMSNGSTIYRVAYADGLKVLGMNEPKYYTVSGGAVTDADFVPNYLRFELTARYGMVPYEWDVKLINNNPFDVSVTYNSRMCFSDAARNFYGLRDLADVTIPANGSATVRIKGNGTAEYIAAAINYTVDGVRYRRVSSANGLTKHSDGTFSTNALRYHEVVVASSFPELSSPPAYLSMTPYSRSGFIWYTWGITIKNNSNFTVEVSYNAKLCFEEDAYNFDGLADIVTITIPPNGSKNVTINHNGTAGWIAASINYSYNGYEYRRITYANRLDINPYRTNQPKHHEIRFT